MPIDLPPLPSVEKLSPRVIRILGGNPSRFALQGTNTYIIGTGYKRLLLDTGGGRPIWLENLQETLKEEGSIISQILITHGHIDHVGGIDDFLKSAPHIAIYKHQAQVSQLEIRDGQKFFVEGASVKAILTPGHTEDHVAFLLEEEDALFTGDLILGHGSVIFQDLIAYMSSLRKLKGLFQGRIYPGHGPVIDDGPHKVLEYILHRQKREDQVIQILSSRKHLATRSLAENMTDKEDWTSMEIMKIMYSNIPENMYLATMHIIMEILRKLKAEGKVIERLNSSSWQLNPLAVKN